MLKHSCFPHSLPCLSSGPYLPWSLSLGPLSGFPTCSLLLLLRPPDLWLVNLLKTSSATSPIRGPNWVPTVHTPDLVLRPTPPPPPPIFRPSISQGIQVMNLDWTDLGLCAFPLPRRPSFTPASLKLNLSVISSMILSLNPIAQPEVTPVALGPIRTL